MKVLWAIIVCCVFGFSCTNKSSESSDGSAATVEETDTEGTDTEGTDTEGTDTEGDIVDLDPLPEPPAAAGQLSIKLSEGVDPDSVEGYIVGKQDQFTVQRAQGDVFFIDNVPPGQHDVVLTAGTLAITTLTNSKDRALRLNQVEFFAGVSTSKENVDIPEAGKISGKVNLIDDGSVLGVKVFIPGTSYAAMTDDIGNFLMENVPVGVHNLAFMFDGYHTGRMENVEVATKVTTTIPDVTLAIDTGASGFVIINQGDASTDSREVTLVIGATDDATLMQLSESDTFQNASWKPVVPTLTYEFPQLGEDEKVGKGEVTLYVRFANANGLETAPFSDSILVDIFEDGGGIEINDGNTTTSLRQVNLGITMPQNAVKMRVSEQEDFSDVDWETASDTKVMMFATPNPTDQDVDHTVYIQFEDADGYYSEVFSDGITLNMYDESGGSIVCDQAPTSTTRNLTFTITVPVNATEMMVSTASNFSSGSWEAANTSKAITVTSQGIMNYYIKFRDADGVEFTNTNWQDSVNVDLIPSGSASFTIVTSTLYSKDGDPDFNATLTYPGNATEMKIAESSQFAGASWVAVASNPTISLPADIDSCGSSTVNLKFRDADGYESVSTWSRNVTYNCWDSASPTATSSPTDRYESTAVWTGTRMIVWGGKVAGHADVNTGDMYDPVTNTWDGVDLQTGAPSARSAAPAVWTGTEMIVWSGNGANTGGMLDPTGPTWTATDTTNAPTGRTRHTAIWTGSEMIVWGGGLNTGGKFDPDADADGEWTAVTTTNAPSGRYGNIAVWTGTHMIIWGGTTNYLDHNSYLGDGAAYDPVGDTWTTLSATNAPDARAMHYGVVIGTKLIVWGGERSNGSSSVKATDGAVYDFSGGLGSGTWTTMNTTNQPSGRCKRDWDVIGYAGVTSDNKMFIWGGVTSVCSSSVTTNTGKLYNPANDTWESLPNSPRAGTQGPAMVFTGNDEFIVWGGWNFNDDGAMLTMP